MLSRRTAVTLLLIFSALPLAALDGADFAVTRARGAALGGPHIALADDFGTLFANPAGLTDVEPHFSFAGIGLAATGPVFTVASLVMQGLGGSDVTDLLATDSVQQVFAGLHARVRIGGPLVFGYAGRGMGFGVLNETDAFMRSTGSSGLELRVGERVVLRGGYAFAMPLPEASNSRLALGVGLKGYVRGDAVVSTSLLALPSLIDSLGLELLSDSPFELTTGLGIDVGVRYVWRGMLAAAITVDNAYSPGVLLAYPSFSGFLDGTAGAATPVYATVPQELNLGLAFTPRLGGVERYVRNLAVLLDYTDILDFWLDAANAENIVLKFGLGLEATFLQILSIRGGFRQGLPAAGLGVRLGLLRLDAAVFGTELSREPGLRPAYNLLVGLEIRQ